MKHASLQLVAACPHVLALGLGSAVLKSRSPWLPACSQASRNPEDCACAQKRTTTDSLTSQLRMQSSEVRQQALLHRGVEFPLSACEAVFEDSSSS